jgi:hypothetical protein
MVMHLFILSLSYLRTGILLSRLRPYTGIYFCLSVWTDRVWTQELTIDRQTLYHLSYTSGSFCSNLFSKGLKVLSRAGLNLYPPSSASHVAEITGVSHCVQSTSFFKEYLLIFPYTASPSGSTWQFGENHIGRCARLCVKQVVLLLKSCARWLALPSSSCF